jgi:hypothetical protein
VGVSISHYKKEKEKNTKRSSVSQNVTCGVGLNTDYVM